MTYKTAGVPPSRQPLSSPKQHFTNTTAPAPPLAPHSSYHHSSPRRSKSLFSTPLHSTISSLSACKIQVRFFSRIWGRLAWGFRLDTSGFLASSCVIFSFANHFFTKSETNAVQVHTFLYTFSLHSSSTSRQASFSFDPTRQTGLLSSRSPASQPRTRLIHMHHRQILCTSSPEVL